MKRCLFFLFFVLILSGCAAQMEEAETSLSPQEMVEMMVDSQVERPEDPDIFWKDIMEEGDDVLQKALADYGVEQEQWSQGCWAYRIMGWKYPFSVLVLRFEGGTPEEEIRQSMLDIIQFDVDRMHDILPESSLYIRDHNQVLIQPPYAAAVICPDMEGAAEKFFSCFTAGESSTAVWKDEDGSLDVTYPYQVPQDRPASIYDCGPVLTAWETEDPSGLKEKDRAVYEACQSVKEELLRPDRSSYETEVAIFDWLLEHVTVSFGGDPRNHDHDEETPYGALVQGEANCLGFATTFQLLMELAGEECITVSGASSQSERFHAWNMVKLDGVWYCVDVSWGKGRFWPYTFLNVSSEFMAKTDHQWDESLVPTAEQDGPRPRS